MKKKFNFVFIRESRATKKLLLLLIIIVKSFSRKYPLN